MKGAFGLLPEQKSRRGDLVTHLVEVGDGKVGDGVGVDLPLAVISTQGVALGCVLVQAVRERDAVFERGVHALSIEGDDGVGRIAHEHDAVVQVPG